MKRKIAAIFAADIAGYSRLVAEDEEETLRRLASYRSVMDDFIVRAGGRIFNTAGDAVLAVFPSAVEAVRCAIDIQESLRTRNLAYPSSRQMSFRIGITIGDVVERDGDLLGDGVNIAARLEGIAPVGGICISRTVHEQVANKLSVQFADIGEQQVKNIPTPIHAYKIEMRQDDGRIENAPAKNTAWTMATAIAAAGVLVIGVAATAYLVMSRNRSPQTDTPQTAIATTVERTTPAGAAEQTAPRGERASPTAMMEQKTAPAPAAGRLVPEVIPLIADRARINVRNEYVSAPDHKALAISSGPLGFITGQADDETAKTAALDMCQKRADAVTPGRQCELYAVGNTVVYGRGHPPMPPTPWIARDPSIERPLVAGEIPLLREQGKTRIEKAYVPGHKPKALAVASAGGYGFYLNQESVDEAARRALEFCGGAAGVPCIIVAVDDEFVVPIPATMKPVGLFRPATSAAVAPGLREDLAQRLANAPGGWSAVAVGDGAKIGLGLKATSEQEAINGALADCAKQDRSCRVIAIGPFSVEPK
jgi:class 3 adenylate cyclase